MWVYLKSLSQIEEQHPYSTFHQTIKDNHNNPTASSINKKNKARQPSNTQGKEAHLSCGTLGGIQTRAPHTKGETKLRARINRERDAAVRGKIETEPRLWGRRSHWERVEKEKDRVEKGIEWEKDWEKDEMIMRGGEECRRKKKKRKGRGLGWFTPLKV